MRKKLTVLLATCLICSVVFFGLSQGTAIIPKYDDHPFHDVLVDYVADGELKGWRIFRDTEAVDPLTRLGFAFAIAKFPDVRSCLKNPDDPLSPTAELDWDRIKRPKQAAICIFNLAHAMGDRETFKKWIFRRYEKVNQMKAFLSQYEKATGDPSYILFITITPETRMRHCVLNLWQCVAQLNQPVALEVSADGKIGLMKILKPKITL
jgi:hypothetical protein